MKFITRKPLAPHPFNNVVSYSVVHRHKGKTYQNSIDVNLSLQPVPNRRLIMARLRQSIMRSIAIVEARAVFRKAFAEDEDFRRTYVDNIACELLGVLPLKYNKKKRDRIASNILHMLLERE